MKTITLLLAAAAFTFAQTPATSAPAKDSTATTAPVKKHSKKHAKKTSDTTAKPDASSAAPAGK
jgi:hypothetical protein